MSSPFVLIVPGLNGSGPAHWQSRWESLYPRTVRVPQRDWDHPDCPEWRSALESAITAAAEPVVLVAHSLGCALVAHLASRPIAARIAAALLVAPADVDSPDRTPPETRSFAPMPMEPLSSTLDEKGTSTPILAWATGRRGAASWRRWWRGRHCRGSTNRQPDRPFAFS